MKIQWTAALLTVAPLVLCACGISTPGTAEPAATAAGKEFSVSRRNSEQRWQGVFTDVVVPSRELCAAGGCDDWLIEVSGADPDGSSQLVVALDESNTVNGFDFLFVLSLYVYAPDGQLVASSVSPFESQVAIAEAVVDGVYRVQVVPERVIGRLVYEAYAALRPEPAPVSLGALLPNLVPLPPANFHLEATPFSAFAPIYWEWRGMEGPTSCYAQERLEQTAERCLRFDQSIANLGDGPLELRSDQIGDGPMQQRIHHGDGSHEDRPVGEVALHLQHGHFHYQDYAQAHLYEATKSGRKGALVRTGRKQGFCMADVANVRFGTPDQTHPAYTAPGQCDGRTEETGSVVGLSVGWADTYPWGLGDQFIEISGVPDGDYVVELVVNTTHALHETSGEDNTAATLIRLEGDEVTVLREFPAK